MTTTNSSYEGLEHLARVTGVDQEFLRSVIDRTLDPYHEFRVPKRGVDSFRTIAAPVPDLARVQRWILDRLLVEQRSEPTSFAYRKGRSIKDCASVHVGAHWLIKLDLQDFFHSVTEDRVTQSFITGGLSDGVARELARLCTRRPTAQADRPYHLPQGAPTSGLLANHAAAALDRSLRALAARNHLKYTRYSDDLTFSSTGEFNRHKTRNFIRYARSETASNGFSLNEKKIRVVPPGSRLIVLGLLVDSDRVRLSRDFKKTLSWHVYGSSRFGLEKYSSSQGFPTIDDYLVHVHGLLAHAAHIDPSWAVPLIRAWNELKVSHVAVP